jgi:hypothetical protein
MTKQLGRSVRSTFWASQLGEIFRLWMLNQKKNSKINEKERIKNAIPQKHLNTLGISQRSETSTMNPGLSILYNGEKKNPLITFRIKETHKIKKN